MKYAFSAILFIFGLTAINAQDTAQSTPGELTVSSSIVCGMCKETIEKGLAYEAGIKSSRVDVDANTIYIKYNEKKIDEAGVKQAINDLGYVADDTKPSKEAYDKLHGCCKAELGKH